MHPKVKKSLVTAIASGSLLSAAFASPALADNVVYGTSGNDVFYGTSDRDQFIGLEGNDTFIDIGNGVNGSGYGDLVRGGAGNDAINLDGDGTDLTSLTILGNENDDLLAYCDDFAGTVTGIEYWEENCGGDPFTWDGDWLRMMNHSELVGA